MMSPVLPRTQIELLNIDSYRRRQEGVHDAYAEQYGGQGYIIGSTDFDPLEHDPNDIMPFSIEEELTGLLQTAEVIPERPLRVEVISGEVSRQDIPEIALIKQSVIDGVMDLVEVSLPSMGDHMVRRGVASTRELLSGLEQQADLQIIIGDFASARAGVSRPQYDTGSTVLLKVNHILEREVPAGMGPVQLVSGKDPVDTDNPEQLQEYNEDLETAHQEQVSRLESFGFVVASAVIDPRLSAEGDTIIGLSVEQVDIDLSEAIKTVASKTR